MNSFRIIHGDVADLRAHRPTDALAEFGGPFDAVFCDPPYGIKFMGVAWDHGVPSAEVWRGVRSVSRPGALVCSFGGTRTWHRLAVNLEDAGLEMRDTVGVWAYGSGWPKPADVSKMIDRRLGIERDVVADNPNSRANRYFPRDAPTYGQETVGASITRPGSPEAERFGDHHANLAPAWEPLLVFRVPLDGTLADNALRHGLAGYDVGDRRTGVELRHNPPTGRHAGAASYDLAGSEMSDDFSGTTARGRWPKNLVLCCDCENRNPDRSHDPNCPASQLRERGTSTASNPGARASGGHRPVLGSTDKPRDLTVHGDTGTVDRYFPHVKYCPKVSPSERGGLKHPTMKPVELCEWFAGLLLPPPRADGEPRRLLVPFSGTGSEVIGALRAGWDEVVGIERDGQWVRASRERVASLIDDPMS